MSALAALALSGSVAFAQSKAPDLGVGPFHINTDRGPVRKVDFTAFKGPASNDVLLGAMSRTVTGKHRIRGLLPEGTQVEIGRAHV